MFFSSTPSGPHASSAVLGDVFLLMGRDLELVDEAPAGSVVGVAGLDAHVIRSATLSSTLLCPPFTGKNDATTRVCPLICHAFLHSALSAFHG